MKPILSRMHGRRSPFQGIRSHNSKIRREFERTAYGVNRAYNDLVSDYADTFLEELEYRAKQKDIEMPTRKEHLSAFRDILQDVIDDDLVYYDDQWVVFLHNTDARSPWELKGDMSNLYMDAEYQFVQDILEKATEQLSE